MYTIVIIIFINGTVSDAAVADSRIVSEDIALTYGKTLPGQIGGSLSITTYPNDWDVKVTIITKIA